MPKPNYQFDKRRRDLEKKAKKEAKRQRKLAPANPSSAASVETPLSPSVPSSWPVPHQFPAAPPITTAILKLARQIDATSSLEYVAVEPGEDCLPDRCFENVARMVKRHGGSVQHGWRMREQASAYVEGEFYAVWRRLEGALIDVTPRIDSPATVLFLPDSRMVWTGDTVEPRRMMLNLQPCYCGSGMPYKICHGLAED